MTPSLNSHHRDSTIISMLVQNKESVWEIVHDKYAPMMYGVILNMTGDDKIAEEIFKETFRELKERRMLSRIYTALCHCLLRHTYRLTLKHLKARKLKPVSYKPLNGSYPLINLLCFELVSLKEAALKSGIPERDVPKKLRAEYRLLWSKSKQKEAEAAPKARVLHVVNDYPLKSFSILRQF
ncbi:MAG: hypothetical protein SH857_09840 [Chitinophagales bacterium]|nr:hypothetical protein [Chitinophagales bacterium]